MTATLAALIQLTASYFTYNSLTRNLELARAIDSIAMVTASSEHVQQFVESSAPGVAELTIRVINKEDLSIMAANKPAEYLTKLSAIGDPDTVLAARRALRLGKFDADLITTSDRRLTVLPLTSARHSLAGNIVLQQARALKPAWHQRVRMYEDEPVTWFARLFRTHRHVSNETFELPPFRYSGVIVIENRQHWIAGMLSGTFVGFAALIFTGFILIMLSGWYFCSHYVLRPVKSLSGVIKQQRKGQLKVRAARSRVSEFDHLARQWNGLLNYKQSAEERHRVLSKVLEHAPVGIEVTDPNALIEYANPAYLEMTGQSLMDIIGKSPKQILGNESADQAALDEASAHISKGQSWHGEIQSRRKDGSPFTNEVTLHPIMSEENDLERVVAVRHDVTERKAYEESLIEARRVSEAAEKSKSEFIARMSHELRTPFNSIIGFADIIAKQQLGPVGNDSYLEFARIIEQSATGLLSIINSIIDLSRMAAGQRPLDEVPVDLRAVAAKVVEASRGIEDDKPVTIEIHDKLDGWTLNADERLLEQMLRNLVSNAVKFNEADGRVDIILRRDRQSRIILEINDTGIGISKADLQSAFKPFVQLQSAYNREHEGIGLGLTLAENQAAVHDAEIKITSRKGRGTKVKVIFPDYRTIDPRKIGSKTTKSAKNGEKEAKAA